ncbi:AAA family ATPase [Desulfurobacterium crinifex]|jgi:type II secretory pathway predicted ATPase ExeA
MRTHVQIAMEKAVKSLIQFYHERGEPLHGAMWGVWMSGKTRAAVSLSKKNRIIRYLKFPERNVTDTQFVKSIALSLGLGPGRSFIETLDNIKETVNHRGGIYVIVIDEAQRLFAKKKFLSILKDLSEEVDLIYLFLGDRNLSRYLHPTYHSLVKRILIRKEIAPIERETVSVLLKKHGYNSESSEILVSLLKKEGITTGELDIALHLARKKKVEKLTEEELRIFLEAAVEGIR